MKEVTKKAIFAEESPVKRWLQERISAHLDEDPELAQPPMEAIYQFCRKSEELVRAMWLATLCHESISQVAEEKEEKTYGKISKEVLGMYSLSTCKVICVLVLLATSDICHSFSGTLGKLITPNSSLLASFSTAPRNSAGTTAHFCRWH